MGRTPGRPKLPETRLRSRTVGVRVSLEELEQLEASAAAVGLDVTTFMRTAALGRRITSRPKLPELTAELVAELGRIGSNLNQAVRAVNRGKLSMDLEPLEQLRAQLAAIRSHLMGEPSK